MINDIIVNTYSFCVLILRPKNLILGNYNAVFVVTLKYQKYQFSQFNFKFYKCLNFKFGHKLYGKQKTCKLFRMFKFVSIIIVLNLKMLYKLDYIFFFVKKSKNYLSSI